MSSTINHVYIPAAGLEIDRIVPLWEAISLTKWKRSVIDTLGIIVKGVEDLDIQGRSVNMEPIVRSSWKGLPSPCRWQV